MLNTYFADVIHKLMSLVVPNNVNIDTSAMKPLCDEEVYNEDAVNVGQRSYLVQQENFTQFSRFILSLDNFMTSEKSNFVDLSPYADETQISMDEIEGIVDLLAPHFFKFAVHFGLSLEELFLLNRTTIGLNYLNFKKSLEKLTVKSEHFYSSLSLMLSENHSETSATVLLSSMKNWHAKDGKSLAQKIDEEGGKSNEVAEYLFSIPFFQKKWEKILIELGISSDEIKSIGKDNENDQNSFSCLIELLEKCQSCSLQKVYDALSNLGFISLAQNAKSHFLRQGYQTTSTLKNEHLNEKLLNYLSPYRYLWQALGYELDLSTETLDQIKIRHTRHADTINKMRYVFKKALQSKQLSKEGMLCALKSYEFNTIGLNKSKQYGIDYDSITAKSSAIDDVINALNTGNQLTAHHFMNFFSITYSSTPEWQLLLHDQFSINFSKIENLDYEMELNLSAMIAVLRQQLTKDDLVSFCQQYLPFYSEELRGIHYGTSSADVDEIKQPSLIPSRRFTLRDALCFQADSLAAVKIAILLGFDPYNFDESVLEFKPAVTKLWCRLVTRYFLLETGHLTEILAGDLKLLQENLPNKGNIGNASIPLRRISPESTFMIESYLSLQQLTTTQIRGLSEALSVERVIKSSSCSLINVLPPTFSILFATIVSPELKKQLWSELNQLEFEHILKRHTLSSCKEQHLASYVQPPEELICPLTETLIQEPVLLELEGGIYIYVDKSALLSSLSKSPCHPFSGQKLTVDEVEKLEVDIELAEKSRTWREQHPEYDNPECVKAKYQEKADPDQLGCSWENITEEESRDLTIPTPSPKSRNRDGQQTKTLRY